MRRSDYGRKDAEFHPLCCAPCTIYLEPEQNSHDNQILVKEVANPDIGQY